jgi:hypothetical protein
MSPAEPSPSAATLSEAKRRLLEKLMRGDPAQAPAVGNTIEPRPTGKPAPLGLAQEQVWRRSMRAAGKPPLYNETITVYREGPLDVALLERCFCEILRRHEAWRSSFDTLQEQPVQIIHPPRTAAQIPLVDLRMLPEEDRETEAVRLASEQAQKPFDLRQGPLLRTLLLRMGDARYRFTITAHQSIVDGVSVYQVLPAELAALYEAFSAGRPSPLPELTIQYGDFAYWQRERIQGEIADQQVAYWRKRLAGELPVLQWPRKLARQSEESFRGVIRPFAAPKGLGEAIKTCSQHEGVTLFMVLLSGFAALLHCYTRQEDILIATLSPAGRKRSEVQGLLGYFLNPVALRFDFREGPTFHELLAQVRGSISEAITNDDVPLEFLAEELKLSSDRDPFVKVAISLQPQVPNPGSGWNVTSLDAQNNGTVWDLYLAFIERERGLIGRAQYNPDVFEWTTIAGMLEDLWRLLQAAASHPATRIKELRPPGL